MTWFRHAFRMQDEGVPYITEEDIGAVAEAVRRLDTGQVERVEFAWTGDSLLFHGRLPGDALPFYPFHSERRGDIVVYHFSRYLPPWLTERLTRRMEDDGAGRGAPDRVRDGTETWYVWRRR
jgi:hypothetical protein